MKDNTEMSSRVRYEQTAKLDRQIKLRTPLSVRKRPSNFKIDLLAISAYLLFAAMVFAAAFGKEFLNYIFK